MGLPSVFVCRHPRPGRTQGCVASPLQQAGKAGEGLAHPAVLLDEGHGTEDMAKTGKVASPFQ